MNQEEQKYYITKVEKYSEIAKTYDLTKTTAGLLSVGSIICMVSQLIIASISDKELSSQLFTIISSVISAGTTSFLGFKLILHSVAKKAGIMEKIIEIEKMIESNNLEEQKGFGL